MKKTLTLLLLLAGLTVEAQGRTLYWTGAESSDWNESDENWENEYLERYAYEDGDAVVFNNAGSGEVNVQWSFSPASVLVNSDRDYTITGDGRFSGSMALTKRGKGTLILNTKSNDYSGGTLIKEGTLVLDNAWALGQTSSITIAGGTLNLGGNTWTDLSISLTGNSNGIGNGSLYSHLTVQERSTLTLCGDLGGGGYIDLERDSMLDLGGHTLTKALDSYSHATICNGKIVLKQTMNGDYNFKNVTLDLNNHEFYGDFALLEGCRFIGNGTISLLSNNAMQVGADSTLTLMGETRIEGKGAITVEEDATTVKALNADEGGLMKELTISKGLIAGTDRQSSLADGLDISRMGDNLTLENLVLTANNKISVGNGHTITLNNVTIKISDDVCQLVNGIYTIDLHNLINCDLKMENVLLDASDLTLPQGFDLAKDAIAFDFGDDVSIQKATGLDMRVGNYMSTSLNLDEQGKVVFKNLVETPEPATGALSLLGLCALAVRRRKR